MAHPDPKRRFMAHREERINPLEFAIGIVVLFGFLLGIVVVLGIYP